MKKEIILPHNHHDSQSHEAILASMPSGESIAVVADALRHLGDPSRLKIFWLLCHCEECVINISALVNLTSAAVSHHLKLLKTSGYIISRREGKEVYYTAAHTPRTQILHEMIEEIAEQVSLKHVRKNRRK